MALFEEEIRKPRKGHEVGQPLDALSVDDLQERIAALRAEIGRLEAELGSRGSTKQAAEALFRRG